MADEQLDYAILISLAMREEAEVMASALRAEGIDAFVGNAHHANVDWGWTLALGGMQVLVPRPKVAEAKQVIRERISEAAANPEGDAVRRRDYWKVWALIAASFGLGWFGVAASTATTLDEDRRNQAWQADMHRMSALSPDYGLDLIREANDFQLNSDRGFCEENPDKTIIVQYVNGEPVEAPCTDILR